MLGSWLAHLSRAQSVDRQFIVVDVTETSSPSDDLRDHLTTMILHARRSTTFLEAAANELGWSEFNRYLAGLEPSQEKMRRGMFGEVLSAGLMTQFHGYVIPVKKLESLITNDQSLPGTDAIAFKIGENQELLEVAFIESKLRTASVTAVAVEGCKQLLADVNSEYPVMLEYVSRRLVDERHLLGQAVLKYLFSRASGGNVDTFHLVMIADESVWSEKALTNLDDANLGLDPLTVHCVRISALAQLVDDVYTSAGIECIPEDE